MKKTILTLTVLALAGQMWGRTLSPSEALSRALGDAATPAKISAMSRAVKNSVTPAYTLTDKLSGNPTLYVITPTDGTGFVIVSADDVAAPLLGYSDNGTFDPNNMPSNLKWWLGQYDEAISYAANNNIEAEYATSSDRKAIAPMVTTKWNQDSPYNDDCPSIGNVVTPSGCVATAMAQIINYHKWPEHGVGTHSYTWNNRTLSFDYANTTFKWDKMLDVYGASATADQKAAVAELMYACGVSVDMQYRAEMSGAISTDVAPALRDYFNYDKGMYTALRYNYTATQWEDLVYDELAAGRPLYYAGQGPEGGHAFVCDGYSQGYFHFNWGWGGMSDGYFLLTALDPASQGIGGYSTGFNQRHTIITGIQKPQEGSELPAPNICLMNFINVYPNGSTLTVTGPFYNYSTFKISRATFQLLLVNDETGEESTRSARSILNMDLSTYTNNFSVGTANIPAGTYTATIGFRYNNVFYPVNPMMGDTGKLKIVSNGNTAEVSVIRSGTIKFSNMEILSPFYVGKVFGLKSDYTYEGSEPVYTKIIPLLFDASGSQIAQGTDKDLEITPGSGSIEYVGEFTTNVPAGNYYICLFRANGANEAGNQLLLEPLSDKMVGITISTLSWTRAAIISCSDWDIKDADKVDPSNLEITASPQVTFGYYASPILAGIFNDNETNLTLANAITTIYSGNMFIDEGQKKTTVIKGDFVAAEAGKTYQAKLFQPSGTSLSSSVKKFTVSDNSALTEIETDNSSDAPVEYFNLQGQRVDNPTPGLYIRRQGEKAEKVYIR